jgi:hypothetical protein
VSDRKENSTLFVTYEDPGQFEILLSRCAEVLDSTASPNSVVIVVIRTRSKLHHILLRPKVGALSLVVEAHCTITQEGC